ncbi:type VI secretion-associated protein, ImpA family (plasmid) [Gemmatirosa kalamazoonensis]|uniref:Type VI secretion-associated protein, ImpA family n=1 Tax=Gemmatirosa kalamazoonensis TaxID=861299 RepID=W0RRP9_9BACT|nr:type VI secretion system protein TssA [Gemmatirosa kalamazoonensis]AHG93000.1 type VI secretion-associated protein, ImpA family [Gemmatirosa kalamazoonensis]
MPPNAELLATLLAPIPGDSPTGKDLRYSDERYDKIEKARKEDPFLPSDGGLATERKIADWPQVISLSSQLLAKETKDLQLAAWLTEALLKREGFGGLSTGLSLLKGLLEQYWDGLYPALDPDEPDDLGVRAGPLAVVGGPDFGILVRQTPIAPDDVSFLDEQASQDIPLERETEKDKEKRAKRAEALDQGKKPPEVVRKAIDGATKAFYKPLVADINAALAALDGLDKAADARFGRDAPGFNALRKALEDVQRLTTPILAEKLAADPDPIEEIPEVAPGDVGAYAPPAGWAGDGSLPPEPISVVDATTRIAVSARYLRKQMPTSPAPFLMLRGLRWGELRAAPEGGGQLDPKLLEAPATAARAKLKGLLLDGNWPELLEQGEALMASPQGRGWLDLQRYTLTACARLGSSYDAVAAAVRSELRALLAALPRLPEMTLMDDTPTANPETREWLAAEGLVADDTETTSDAAEEPEDPRAATLAEALAQDDATSATGGLARARATPNGRRRADGRALGTPDAFSLARAELAQNRPSQAIEVLAAELARTRSPRGRFVRQTQIAYIMVEAGLDAVARPILDKLIEDINERKLDEWESGSLVAQPMALLCRVMDRAGESGKPRSDLYLRICRLDPMQALGLQAGA